MRIACVISALCAGCYAQAVGAVKSASDGARGGQVEGVVGDDNFRYGGSISIERAMHAGDGTTAVMFEYIFRASVLGPLHLPLNRDNAPWVDLGPEVNLGFGGASHGPIASASAGGWLDVRLWPDNRSYPALHFGARRIIYAGPVDDESALFIGLAWTARDPHASIRMPD